MISMMYLVLLFPPKPSHNTIWSELLVWMFFILCNAPSKKNSLPFPELWVSLLFNKGLMSDHLGGKRRERGGVQVQKSAKNSIARPRQHSSIWGAPFRSAGLFWPFQNVTFDTPVCSDSNSLLVLSFAKFETNIDFAGCQWYARHCCSWQHQIIRLKVPNQAFSFLWLIQYPIYQIWYKCMEPIDQPNRLSGKPFFKHCNQLNWGHNGTSFHVLAWVLQGFIGMVEQVHMHLSVFVLQVFLCVSVNMCLLEWWNKITCVGMFVHSTSRTKFTCVSACLHVFLCV